MNFSRHMVGNKRYAGFILTISPPPRLMHQENEFTIPLIDVPEESVPRLKSASFWFQWESNRKGPAFVKWNVRYLDF